MFNICLYESLTVLITVKVWSPWVRKIIELPEAALARVTPAPTEITRPQAVFKLKTQ